MALTSASRKEADAFLRAQRELIEDQRHHLHEQLKQLSLGLWEKRIGMMLRLAMLAVGLKCHHRFWHGGVECRPCRRYCDRRPVGAAALCPDRYSSEVLADDLMNRVADTRAIECGKPLDDPRPSAVTATRISRVEFRKPAFRWERSGTTCGFRWVMNGGLPGDLRDMGDGAIALTVSLEGEATVSYDGKADELDRLEQQAAETCFPEPDPQLLPSIWRPRGHFAEAMAVTQSSGRGGQRSDGQGEAYSLLSWETEHGTGDMALAGARNRLAISIYPKAAAHVEIMPRLPCAGS